jgi:microcystin-dependent protein
MEKERVLSLIVLFSCITFSYNACSEKGLENVQAQLSSSGSSGWSTGDVKLTFKNVADSGWVLMNDGTIGDAQSGATLANNETQSLFYLLWANCADAQCPVSSGRGLSAAADFSAHKSMMLPKALGRALAGAGAGAGLSPRALGSIAGAETHTLSVAQMPAHSHVVNFSPNFTGGTGNLQNGVEGGNGVNSGAAGGNQPHNIMQPTLFLNVMMKL